MSDVGNNFKDRPWNFWWKLNIEHVVSLSYPEQNNGEEEA